MCTMWEISYDNCNPSYISIKIEVMSFKNTSRSSVSRKRKRCGILRATTYRKRQCVVVTDVVTTSTGL